MNLITVNAELRAKLHGLRDPVDFCDEQGQLLGRFVPYPTVVAPADLEPAISHDELRRRADQFHGRPLADLTAEWEQRK
jgi:hypothetical protein